MNIAGQLPSRSNTFGLEIDPERALSRDPNYLLVVDFSYFHICKESNYITTGYVLGFHILTEKGFRLYKSFREKGLLSWTTSCSLYYKFQLNTGYNYATIQKEYSLPYKVLYRAEEVGELLDVYYDFSIQKDNFVGSKIGSKIESKILSEDGPLELVEPTIRACYEDWSYYFNKFGYIYSEERNKALTEFKEFIESYQYIR